MGKKKKGSDVPSTHQDRHTKPRVVFHPSAALLAVIDRKASANYRTRTAEMVRLLEKALTDEGDWPPPGTGEPPSA